MTLKELLTTAAHIKPAKNQLKMLRETPFYAFLHFSPNTFTGLEWGTGKEDPAIFNPKKLDCEQWAKAIKAAGMKGMVLTAKHHDGFCLWQTETTMHSMKSSPYKNGKGDIVREASEAAKKYGLKFGFYLSPWDRNCPLYGTEEYNDFYKRQLTELLTGYGEIFHVWFDGACGEGPNGRKMEYDFEGYCDLVRKYQPNATIFNDGGTMRWCGNEAGKPAYAQWAVVPVELCFMNKEVTPIEPLFDGSLEGIRNWESNLGSVENIACSKGLVFAPSETDMSIRDGWFYHPEEEPHSLDRLFTTYLNTVGNNGTFHLNIPPTPDGLLDERDVKRLAELGEKIESEFAVEIGKDAVITVEGEDTLNPQYTIKLPEKRTVKYVELAENIAEGQRVAAFNLYNKMDDGRLQEQFHGTTIGSKRIIAPMYPCYSDELIIKIMSTRDKVDMEYIKIY